MTRSIEEIREAAGRLHATAWHGRKTAAEAARKVDPPATFVARFSIPRQPTDDDEVVYSAIEELAALRSERADLVAWLRKEARAVEGMVPVDRDVVGNAIAEAIEQGTWRRVPSNSLGTEGKGR